MLDLPVFDNETIIRVLNRLDDMECSEPEWHKGFDETPVEVNWGQMFNPWNSAGSDVGAATYTIIERLARVWDIEIASERKGDDTLWVVALFRPGTLDGPSAEGCSLNFALWQVLGQLDDPQYWLAVEPGGK